MVEPIDVQLVLLPLIPASREEEGELRDAVRSGQASKVEAILSRPQNPDVQHASRFAPGPLHVAARHNHLEILRLLLEARADMDAICAEETPLGTASAAGRE